jgi:hypothetical protein
MSNEQQQQQQQQSFDTSDMKTLCEYLNKQYCAIYPLPSLMDILFVVN